MFFRVGLINFDYHDIVSWSVMSHIKIDKPLVNYVVW